MSTWIKALRLFFALAFSATFTTPASASFQSQDDITNWFTFYYQKPDPSKIPGAIEYLSQSGMLDRKNAISPIFGFLAGSFKNNPEQVGGWVDRLSALKESHLGVVVLGLWYADLPDSQQRVYALLDQHPDVKVQFRFLYQGVPMPVEKIPLEQGPWVLDALWGNFMATGNKAPVVRIMQALPWIDTKGDINRLLIGGAARWSLTSNAVQHQRVLGFCEVEVENQPKEVAEKLREVITSAKQELKNNNNKAPQPTSTLLRNQGYLLTSTNVLFNN